MIIIPWLLGCFVVWSLATVVRTGHSRVGQTDWNDDDSARFMVQAAQSCILALGFLGLLLK